MKLGIKRPLAGGLLLMLLALLLLARAPVDGDWAVDILPATLLIGLGAGIAFNPILLTAMSGVEPARAGLASGVVNTSFMMGGAVGLAVLVATADSRTRDLLAGGDAQAAALNGGYHVGFVVGAAFVALAIAIGALLVRETAPAPVHGGEAVPEAA